MADRLGARCLSRFRAARIRRVRPGSAANRAASSGNARARRTGVSGAGRRRADRGDARISGLSSAQFIASYDAGRGQRYYLFGSDLPFAALVKYYQSALKNRGTLVFDAPATHVFEIGRFREETMAFPPGVTIKDYTWNGSAGYLNPKRNGSPRASRPSFRSSRAARRAAER